MHPRLPPSLLSDEHRKGYKAFCEGQLHAVPHEDQRRMYDLDVQFRSAAIGYVDSIMSQFADGLADKTDIPLAYTLGQHLRSMGMFAALWTEMRTAIAFNREERIKLEKRIAELEQAPQISYNGIFAADKQYKPGDLTTFRGSLWHCNVATIGVTPGDGCYWTLVVKRGRNARNST
ncbi:hypothetical protein ACVWZV_009245 [Bradyrhizobium sp. GM5.1]